MEYLTHMELDTNTFRILLLCCLTLLSSSTMIVLGAYRLWKLRSGNGRAPQSLDACLDPAA